MSVLKSITKALRVPVHKWGFCFMGPFRGLTKSVPPGLWVVNFLHQRILGVNGACPWMVHFTSQCLAGENPSSGRGAAPRGRLCRGRTKVAPVPRCVMPKGWVQRSGTGQDASEAPARPHRLSAAPHGTACGRLAAARSGSNPVLLSAKACPSGALQAALSITNLPGALRTVWPDA